VPLLVVALLLFAAWFFLERQNELFRLSVRHGRVLLVRGRIPPGLLGDIRDAVARPPVPHGTIRAVKHDGGARLTASGAIDEGRAQRLRNIFQLYPVSKLRAAPALARPTMGQILGIAWLAWLLDRRG
jgi:hypothetical protein